jgi:hypothetical protein
VPAAGVAESVETGWRVKVTESIADRAGPAPGTSAWFAFGWSWMTGVMMWLNREYYKLAANLWQSSSAPLGLRLTAHGESKRNPRVSEWLDESQPDTRQQAT